MQTQRAFKRYLIPLSTITIVLILGIVWTIPTVQSYFSTQSSITLMQQEIDSRLIPQRETLTTINTYELQLLLDEVKASTAEVSQPAFLLSVMEEVGRVHAVTIEDPGFVSVNDLANEVVMNMYLVASGENLSGFFEEFSTIMPTIVVRSLAVDTKTGFLIANQEEGVEDQPATIRAYIQIAAPLYRYSGEDSSLVQVLSDTDRSTAQEILSKKNYYDSPLNKDNIAEFPHGKTDLFNYQ